MYLLKRIDKDVIGEDAQEFGGDNDREGCHNVERTADTRLARSRKRKATHNNKLVIGLKIEYPWIIHFSLILYSN